MLTVLNFAYSEILPQFADSFFFFLLSGEPLPVFTSEKLCFSKMLFLCYWLLRMNLFEKWSSSCFFVISRDMLLPKQFKMSQKVKCFNLNIWPVFLCFIVDEIWDYEKSKFWMYLHFTQWHNFFWVWSCTSPSYLHSQTLWAVPERMSLEKKAVKWSSSHECLGSPGE